MASGKRIANIASALGCATLLTLPAQATDTYTQPCTLTAAEAWASSAMSKGFGGPDNLPNHRVERSYMNDFYANLDKSLDTAKPAIFGDLLENFKQAYLMTTKADAGKLKQVNRYVLFAVTDRDSIGLGSCDESNKICQGKVFSPQSPEMRPGARLADNPIVAASLKDLSGTDPDDVVSVTPVFHALKGSDAIAAGVPFADAAGSFTPQSPVADVVAGMAKNDADVYAILTTPGSLNRPGDIDLQSPLTRALACRFGS